MKACFYLCLTWHTKHTELNIIALFYTSKLKLLEAKDIFLHKWVLYNFLFLSFCHGFQAYQTDLQSVLPLGCSSLLPGDSGTILRTVSV